jgi:hippurate hydrolase
MHACGHDGHMSALLGFAKRLKESQDVFSYNILLIFQPAEESPGAAKDVVATGIFKKYHVRYIFGMHLMPLIEEGVIACKAGALMAMCGELDVTIKGKASHAGLSHKGIDSIMIATNALQQYQTLVSRQTSPFQPVVLNVGKISGGTARNSVASECELHGTVRCYSEDMFQTISEGIGKIHRGLETSYGCQIEWSLPPLYPPLINDNDLYQQFNQIVEHQHLDEPMMLAEDFSYYQKEIPGLFFFLGTKTKEYDSGLHTETFNFNEDVLEKTVDTYYQLAISLKEERK